MTFVNNLVDSCTAFFLHRVFGYRKKVIEQNLESAFTYSSSNDLKKDIKENYSFLAKVFRQIIARPSTALLQKRMELQPCPELQGWLQQNKSVLITFGHIGNWEWAGSYVGLKYPDQVCALYKKDKIRICQFVDEAKAINTCQLPGGNRSDGRTAKAHEEKTGIGSHDR